MLKKSVLVMFIISMLFMMSCSDDPTSSDPVTAYRMVERNDFDYEPATNTWILSSEWNLDYDTFGRIEFDYGIDYYDGDQEQETFAYDNTSTVLPSEFINYDDAKDWIIDERAVFTYENGKVKEAIQEYYLEGNIAASIKIEYTYENSLLTSFIIYEDNAGVWEKTSEKTWAYTSGQLTEYINAYSDGYSNKSTYSYENDKLSEMIEYDWNVVGWELYNKSVYSYEDGKLKEVVDYQYYNSEWRIKNKTISLYTNEHLSSEITSLWDDYEQVLKNYWKTGFEYDENWNIVAYIYYDWDGGMNEYVLSFKTEFIYEKAHGNYRDILKVMNPDIFYTGLMMFPDEVMPSKGLDKDTRFFEFFKR
ncbi:MAG: hypothetical protein GQ534_08020 [Candidatus Delongbacteria bacterium]|nr:hypothetical protein [Candidatus Delongbacteria bacterium]